MGTKRRKKEPAGMSIDSFPINYLLILIFLGIDPVYDHITFAYGCISLMLPDQSLAC